MILLDGDPLLPAPLNGEILSWQDRSVTTTEAGRWLRQLLAKCNNETLHTTIHTLKSTPLSWCAKSGLDENTRLLLGHHSTGKKATEVYARDVLAAPLRHFDQILQQIRSGAFRPDATRSGMVTDACRPDPMEKYIHETEKDKSQESDSTDSSSSSESESDEDHKELTDPNDPVVEARIWDPDLDMFQHKKSKIVHVRAVGSQQETFSCGVRKTSEYIEVTSAEFLEFRKCKRCATAKPIKDVGALASALKKRRLEVEAAKRSL